MLAPTGPPSQVLLLGIDGPLQLCISGSVFAEYEDVLRRPKFGFDEAVTAGALQTIRARALWVRPSETVSVCPDHDDDAFLACAAAATARYLVTGNLRHFPQSWRGVEVVVPAALLEILARGTTM